MSLLNEGIFHVYIYPNGSMTKVTYVHRVLPFLFFWTHVHIELKNIPFKRRGFDTIATSPTSGEKNNFYFHVLNQIIDYVYTSFLKFSSSYSFRHFGFLV